MFVRVEVQVEPHRKQLHVTLAYHFPSQHLAPLEKLARGIEVKLGCDWLAVLFSRDIRFANHEVSDLYSRVLIHTFKPLGTFLLYKYLVFSGSALTNTFH